MRIKICDNSVEWFYIEINDKSYALVSAVYFPPTTDMNVSNKYIYSIDNLLSNNSRSKFLIFGDYNLPNINWQSYNGSFEFYLIAGFSYLNLRQFNLIHNHSGSLLDLGNIF